MAENFNYTKSWLNAADFPLLGFSRNWENPSDYPTIETDEAQVRRDMQSLHDEVKDYLNETLIPRVIAEDATVAAWQAQEDARAEAEAGRVLAEDGRVLAEQSRVAAERARVDETSGIVAQATAQAKAAEESAIRAEQAALGQIPDGSLEPVKFSETSRSMMVRPNLLDNGYFGNPVDQRGGYVAVPGAEYRTNPSGEEAAAGIISGYVPATKFNDGWYNIVIGGVTYWVASAGIVRGYTGAGYTIDRWKLVTGAASVVESGLYLNNAFLDQYFEDPFVNSLVGETVTISALSDRGLTSATAVVTPKSTTEVDIVVAGFSGGHFSLKWTNTGVLTARFYASPDGITIIAAKLELGTQQTLAHQDENGVWVLNEIPEKNRTLADCQNYLIPFGAWRRIRASAIDANSIHFDVPISGQMRSKPTFVDKSSGGVAVVNFSNNQTDTTFTIIVEESGAGYIRLSAYKEAHGLTDAYLALYSSDAMAAYFDANL